jgi:hypothetical protein
MDLLFVAGRDQSAADQPSNLAEGHSTLLPFLLKKVSMKL